MTCLDQLDGDVDQLRVGPVQPAGHGSGARRQVTLDLVTLHCHRVDRHTPIVHLFERRIKTVISEFCWDKSELDPSATRWDRGPPSAGEQVLEGHRVGELVDP